MTDKRSPSPSSAEVAALKEFLRDYARHHSWVSAQEYNKFHDAAFALESFVRQREELLEMFLHPLRIAKEIEASMFAAYEDELENDAREWDEAAAFILSQAKRIEELEQEFVRVPK